MAGGPAPLGVEVVVHGAHLHPARLGGVEQRDEPIARVVVEVGVVDREIERTLRSGEEVEQSISCHLRGLTPVGEEVDVEIR